MNAKRICDVEAFVKETEKIRNISLSSEDIKRINDLSREVEIEDSKIDEKCISDAI